MNKRTIIVTLAVFFLLPGLAVAGFTDNGNGTVTDATTNLMWQKQDDATTHTWDLAISYCETLSLGGFTDWRLPNVKELRSIVDSTIATGPVINTTFFPATQPSSYWSSTTYMPSTTSAWMVSFGYGGVDHNNKTATYYVRCVR